MLGLSQAPATPSSWRWKAVGSVVVLALVARAAGLRSVFS